MKSRFIQLTEDMVRYTMVDLPELEDLAEPEMEGTLDQSELTGGSGLFWCDTIADKLEFEAEIIEFEDIIEIVNKLEYFDLMLYKLGKLDVKDPILNYDDFVEERKRKNAEAEDEDDEESYHSE